MDRGIYSSTHLFVAAPPVQPFPIQEQLVGKTKREILACACSPLNKNSQGEITVLTYYKQAPPLEQSAVGSKGSIRPSGMAAGRGCASRTSG